MMAALATIEDYELFTGTTASGATTARIQRLLEMASAVVRSYCGWSISAEEDVTLEVKIDHDSYEWRSKIYLPTLYLTAVGSVEDDQGTTYTADEDFTWSESGVIERSGGVWWPYNGIVTVEYSHGYESVPDEAVVATVGIASELTDNPGAVRSESVGSYSVSYSPDAGSYTRHLAMVDGLRIVRL